MERRLSAASRRSAPSPIQQLSHLAQRVGAVNLAEGFPDFPAPPHVKAAAAAAIAADHNQYRSVSASRPTHHLLSRSLPSSACFGENASTPP
jgi:aspartate/methionine/tyrosine aminotransferase